MKTDETKKMSFLKLWIATGNKEENYRVNFSMVLADGEYTAGSLSYDYRPKLSSTVQSIYQLVSN